MSDPASRDGRLEAVSKREALMPSPSDEGHWCPDVLETGSRVLDVRLLIASHATRQGPEANRRIGPRRRFAENAQLGA